MRFIRSRFGIVLWCTIALLVLIVPLWRLRATRQLRIVSVQGTLAPEPSMRIYGEPEPTRAPIPFGLSEAQARAAAKDFPDDIAAQLARLNYGDLNREINEIKGTIASSIFSNEADVAKERARLSSLDSRIWKLTDAYFAQYDELMRRFPDSQLVRAQYLREVLSWTNITDEGPFARADEKAIAETNSRTLIYDSSASPATIEKAIRVARDGARQQPDNAYFSWAQAIFQFERKRPQDALKTLEAAARCPMFDDYTYEGVARRIDVLKRLQSVGWEDEMIEWFQASFPHYSKMRSATRAATGQMRLARRRGDEKAAFRWIAATAGAAYPVARSERNSLIGKLVGQALCSTSWRAAIEDERNPKGLPLGDVPGQTDEEKYARYARYYQNISERFAQIARANGDETLARQTLALPADFTDGPLNDYLKNSILFQNINRLSAAYWLGAQLLRIALGGALLWFVCWFLTRRSTTIAATRAKMLLPAMFSAGVTGAITVGALSVSPRLYSLIGGLFENPTEENASWMIATLRDYWPALIGLLWAFVILGIPLVSRAWRSRSADKTARQKKPLSLARVIVALFAIAAIIGLTLLLLINAPADGFAVWVSTSLSAVPIAVAAGASLTLIYRARGAKRAVAICAVVAFWLFIAIPFAQSSRGDGPFYASILQICALLFALAALILASRLWKLPLTQIQNIAIQLAARTRIAAGVLALLCALAYLGISLWTIPIESKTRAMMQRQLQIGEVAWLREQMK